MEGGACIPLGNIRVAETLPGKLVRVGHQCQGKNNSVVKGYSEGHLSQGRDSQTSGALLCQMLSEQVGTLGEQIIGLASTWEANRASSLKQHQENQRTVCGPSVLSKIPPPTPPLQGHCKLSTPRLPCHLKEEKKKKSEGDH